MLLFISGTLPGQALRSFSTDSVAFVQEMRTFFDQIINKENKAEALATLETFGTLWQNESFDATEKQQIYHLSNLMLGKRLRSYPDFVHFLQALSAMKTKAISADSYRNWLLGADITLQNKRGGRDFGLMLQFTAWLLNENVLYRTRTFEWRTDAAKFAFVADSNFRVQFPKLNLKGVSKNDSTTLMATGGTYDPINEVWQGNDGKITWQRAGLPADSVYVLLGDYRIDLRSSGLTADSVRFYNLAFFGQPMLGSVQEKVSADRVTPDNALYPYFQSYIRSLFIDGIFEDVDYEGGFAMKGAKIIGTGDDYTPAKLTFKRPYRDKQGKYDLLIARSDAFVIEPDRINAASAAVTIYHQDDSLFHAGLRFRYMHPQREVSMLRTDRGLMESPWFDTYHHVDIDCEGLYWRMDEPEIRFRALMGVQQVSNATFVSRKFYNEGMYDAIQGIDYTSPLVRLYQYSKEYDTRKFYIEELARFIKYPVNQTESMVIGLAREGFIFYNLETQQGIITDKTFHFVDARSLRTDYDVIAFRSYVEKDDNALLSLDNFDLKIKGVPVVSISDSQNVYIYPKEQELVLRKNLDFLFSGRIKAGLFEFMAQACLFEYDTFRLNLPTIEYMKFKVRAFDAAPGEQTYVDVKTVVSDISGDLLIDYPTNKSGLKDYPRYPIFNSKSESYVYYDQDSAYKKAYARDRFYYNLKPFTLESLVNASTENLIFDGYLYSGGIFQPEVNKPLSVMKDYSLGFEVTSPPGGYPVYNNKGMFTDTVRLSMSGLQGTGTITYLNTTTKGRNMMFFLDSVNAVADRFEITAQKSPQTPFPSVKGKNIEQRWWPYQDTMLLATTDSAFRMFDDKVKHKGQLVFATHQLTGSGTMRFYGATTTSMHYLYGNDYFDSDTLNLKINSLDDQQIAFASDRYNAHVDFSSGTGSFAATDKRSQINLLLTQYLASMESFDWHIHRREIEMRSNATSGHTDFDKLSLREKIDAVPDGARLVSTHPLQDSLAFNALQAAYSLDSNTLMASGVKIIKVADAAIFPGDGRVSVKTKAVMAPLRGASIIADTINKIHLIKGAEVSIESRYFYRANGTYAYSNLLDKEQIVQFDNIYVDSGYQTVAQGQVLPEQKFMFSPQWQYRGTVNLNARDPLLDFDGAFMPMQDCDKELARWVKFRQRVQPDSLVFPVPAQPEEYAYKKLYAGFFHSNEDNRVYPAFLSRKGYYSDTLMLSVEGAVTARNKGREFLIAAPGDLDTPLNLDPPNPWIRLNTDQCHFTASGPLNFGADFGAVVLQSFGNIDHYIIPDSTRFDAFFTIDFPFKAEALTLMLQDLDKANTAGIKLSGGPAAMAYRQLLGTERATEVIYNLSTFGTLRRVPDELKKSLVISQVTFRYNPASRSFISEGKIGVGMVAGEPVNKYFDGFMEIVRKRSGDILTIYIEIDRRQWYIFQYSGNLMQATSSNNDYNNILIEEVTNRKDKGDEQGYRYINMPTSTKNRILRAWRTDETNQDE
ncbi:MAG: hypothetical protein EOM83_12710 [Clostridia bacterium]|nr:hypothetical protein [Clostridia bacterium]